MTGGDVLVEGLQANGIEVVFGLPGVQLDAAVDAFARRQDTIRLYHTRHEQATSYMAWGYATATGRTGCCMVVPGPGLLNAATGLSCAHASNAPVVCVAAQIPSAAIDRGLGYLHEIPHQVDVLRAVTKWTGRAMAPHEVQDVVSEAFRRVAEGRPRPVAVEVPSDVLEAECEAPPAIRPAPPPAGTPWPGSDDAVALLSRAERPLIMAGGGVIGAGAGDELRQLAERLGAPVLTSANGRGAIPTEHPLAFPVPCAGRLVPAADVILAVGTRLARFQGRRWELGPGQTLIRIDVDREEIDRDIVPSLALVADARAALSSLAEAVDARTASGWRDLDRLREEIDGIIQRVTPQAAFGAAIRRALPDDSVLVSGMNQVGYWAQIGYPVRRPRTFLGPGYQGALGYEVPTGLGAQVGRPDTRVVVLCGDGGFLFNVQELATAAQHHIPAIIVVFNDGAYGNVKRIQKERFGRLLASELRNPDFMELAHAFGIEGMRTTDPEGLGAALGRALAIDGPVLIEVPVGEMDSPWAMLRG